MNALMLGATASDHPLVVAMMSTTTAVVLLHLLVAGVRVATESALLAGGLLRLQTTTMDVETVTDVAHLLHVATTDLLPDAMTTPTKPVALLRLLAVAIPIPTLEVAIHMRVLAALPVAMAMVEVTAATMTDDTRSGTFDRHA